MKRILIVNNNLYIGGVQKALIGLLKEISGEYDTTLFLFYPGGELLREIPPQVKVIQAAWPLRTLGMDRNDSRKNHLMIERAFYAIITRTVGRKWALRLQFLFQKKLKGYDVAISYLHSGAQRTYYGGCNESLLNRVEAKKKITFLHCDYGKIHADSKENTALYRRFDRIAACSEGCRRAFIECIPDQGKRTAVVHNCQDYSGIRRRAALEEVRLPDDYVNVVVVARFGREKGLPRAVRAIFMLGAAGQRIRCYLIGDGVELEKTRVLATELGLQKQVMFLGELSNPYGYIKAADLLLIPSYSEAAPMVIGEAACLGTPVLSTATSSAEEMVAETGYGWVCENSCEGICEGLKGLLTEPGRLKKCETHLQQTIFSNETAVEEFRQLLS